MFIGIDLAWTFISHNTIKSYTKSIYRKLGVTSRSAALEAAADLDLV